jgi:hypothetical protein
MKSVFWNIDRPARFIPDGWSGLASLIGSRDHRDDDCISFQPRTHPAAQEVTREFSHRASIHFLSVTEAGLFTSRLSWRRMQNRRGGEVGDEIYRAEMAARVQAERDSDHIRRRLYPPAPPADSYVCFYR